MWRRTFTAVTCVVAALVLPVAAATIGISTATDQVYAGGVSDSAEHQAMRSASHRQLTIAPGKPTVAIVLGADGSNVADTLAPYEVFATTGEFNVLTVAPTLDPVTLTGGLDLLPDLSFAQLDSRLPDPPDVIVVPQIHGSTSAVVDWLQAQRRQGAPLIMSVCVGAKVLAETGLLENRAATSHWLGLIGLRRSQPEVKWTDGVRFVDDGDLITTAGVLRGIDGSLRVVERLVGPAVATQVARELHWSGYQPGRTVAMAKATPAPADLVGLMSAGYRWDRPQTGVLLGDGVGEIELASAFRPYTELSYLATMEAVSADGGPIRSRHGLTFLPRADLEAAAPGLDRLLIPGSASLDTPAMERLTDADVEVVRLHQAAEFPFDGALRDIADTYDVATARWVAKSLQYPVAESTLQGKAWPWALTLRPLLLAALGVGLVLMVGRLRARQRRDG